jgi:hypothetical protein
MAALSARVIVCIVTIIVVRKEIDRLSRQAERAGFLEGPS